MKGQTSAALEATRATIEQGVEDNYKLKLNGGTIFVIIAIGIFSIGLLLFVLSNQPVVPDGCAVVDNLSACRMEERTDLMFLGENWWIISPSTTRVCEKEIVCYDGSIGEWP